MGFLTALHRQMTDAFDAHAREGAALYHSRHGATPALSHMCFKFASVHAYEDYLIDAAALGALARRRHKGFEITWCHLREPLVAGELRLHWLELVHPEQGSNAVSGVTSIGYVVPGLGDAVKLPSSDPDIMFRYQGVGAEEIVGL